MLSRRLLNFVQSTFYEDIPEWPWCQKTSVCITSSKEASIKKLTILIESGLDRVAFKLKSIPQHSQRKETMCHSGTDLGWKSPKDTKRKISRNSGTDLGRKPVSRPRIQNERYLQILEWALQTAHFF